MLAFFACKGTEGDITEGVDKLRIKGTIVKEDGSPIIYDGGMLCITVSSSVGENCMETDMTNINGVFYILMSRMEEARKSIFDPKLFLESSVNLRFNGYAYFGTMEGYDLEIYPPEVRYKFVINTDFIDHQASSRKGGSEVFDDEGRNVYKNFRDYGVDWASGDESGAWDGTGEPLPAKQQ